MIEICEIVIYFFMMSKLRSDLIHVQLRVLLTSNKLDIFIISNLLNLMTECFKKQQLYIFYVLLNLKELGWQTTLEQI